MRYYSKSRGRVARRTLMATGAAALALGIATPAFASTAAPAHAHSSSRPSTDSLTATGAAFPAHLYWADADEPLAGTGAGMIVKANLDGSSPQTIVTGQNIPFPFGMAVDRSHIYWTDATLGTVMAANLDGTGVTTLASRQDFPVAVAVNNGHIYWADEDGGTIMAAKLDGTTRPPWNRASLTRPRWRWTTATSTGQTRAQARSWTPTWMAAGRRPSPPARTFRSGWRSARSEPLGMIL